MAKRSFVFSVFFLLIFILAISEIASAVDKQICEKPSKTYSGNCYSKQCDEKCRKWEYAKHGACHKRETKNLCFCYFLCSAKGAKGAKKVPPSKDGSPPGSKEPPSAPGKGGSPPAAGGSPSPPAAGGSPPADGGGSPPASGGGGSPPASADGGSAPPASDGSSTPKADKPCKHIVD